VKGLAVAVLWVSVCTVSEARSKPRWIAPFERHCLAPASWATVQKCIDTHDKGATVRSLSADVRVVESHDTGEYMFARFGERWHMIYRPGDANYELVERSKLTMPGRAALRIDLVHHIPIDRTGEFFERISLVCEPAGDHCDAYVTACTVLDRGRAVETFRGQLKPTAEGLTLIGDRSYTGRYCRSR
jgi:hypothetical protein